MNLSKLEFELNKILNKPNMIFSNDLSSPNQHDCRQANQVCMA